MNKPTLAFIGAGNMASSLIAGLIANGYEPNLIWATDPTAEKIKHLAQEFQIHTTTDNAEGITQADVVILAVKPQVMESVLVPLRSIIQEKKPLLISIAAMINIRDLEQWLGQNIAIVRCMPNTPALVQSGATALFANPNVSSVQKQIAESILRAVGITLWFKQESDLNIATVISGCGPAYFFLLMEIMQDAAVKMGLTSEAAQLLTEQTAIGAARLALESTMDPAGLRRQVTSPGGITEKIINVLEAEKIRDTFFKALSAGKEHTETLRKKE